MLNDSNVLIGLGMEKLPDQAAKRIIRSGEGRKMKTKLLFLSALLAFSVVASGCTSIAKFAQMSGSELMDLVAEPHPLYHSGHDMLSGQYKATPIPGDSTHKAENLTITKNSKGWEVKDDSANLGLHTYEMSPEQARKGISGFNEKTMQCLDQKYMLRICAVPKGTKVHFEGKVKENKDASKNNVGQSYTATSETGYVMMFNDGTWMHLAKQ